MCSSYSKRIAYMYVNKNEEAEDKPGAVDLMDDEGWELDENDLDQGFDSDNEGKLSNSKRF